MANSQYFDVRLVFGIPIPVSACNAQKNAKLWGFELPLLKDLDNCEKFYLDSMSGICFHDDRQVVSLSSKKLYTEKPFTIIKIKAVETQNLSKIDEKIMSCVSPKLLQELVDDCKKIAQIDTGFCDSSDQDTRELFLSTTAVLLADFAKKYGKILKCIEKVGATDGKK